MAKERKRTPETVYTVTQKERARPFKEKLKEYRQKLREKISKKPTTVSERLGSLFAKGASYTQRGAFTRRLYGQPVSPYGSNISNLPPKGIKRTGRRGRPVGTVKYRHPDTGEPIGVYEYRKILSSKNRIAELQARAKNPAQQEILRRIEAREEYRRRSPESRTIPSTAGDVAVNDIMGEIDRATHILD